MSTQSTAVNAETKARSNQLLLPFAEKEYVDVRRAASILGMSRRGVLDLHRRRLIVMINWGKHKQKRVHYQSLVDFCDTLRSRYCIPDRRPPLSNPYLRHHDADLLPFPLSDTIGALEAMEALGYVSTITVVRMIEEGAIEGYHLCPVSPWRISRSSVVRFLESIQLPPKSQP